MGYSRSLTTVRRREIILAPLLKGQPEVTWHSTYEEAPKLAYKIQECLHIARDLPTKLPSLARAAARYRISVEGTCVVARLRQDATPLALNAPAGAMVLSHASTSAEVIQAWIDMQPAATPLALPTAALPASDRAELQQFCLGLEPPWELLVQGETLILRPTQPVSLGNSL